MYYQSYPYGGWAPPWGPPMGMGYPMTGGWMNPYGGMPQMPYYPQPGGYGAPEMSQMPYYPPPGGFGGPGMSPFGPPMGPEQEINYLRDQAQMLKQQMDQIDARIKELEKGVK
jgi:hypothetical protein